MVKSTIKFIPVDWLLMPGDTEPMATEPVFKELPERILGDSVRLKQVLINLLRNSIKFAMGKAIEIRACYNKRLKQLQVHVSDQGAGISMQSQS